MNTLLPLTSSNGNAALRGAQIAAQRAQQTAALEAKTDGKTMAKIDKAAKDFEAVFATEMLKPMFEDVNKGDGPFGGGRGEKIFGGMMLNEYGKQIADRDGLGIAGEVKAQLLRLQEAKTHGH
jgi:Rod binding domain-containing protein